eukprot:GHUV01016117.1.p1 GENE.GHUV01016117.1~~GHUV01016117.1.p1  ORF type:complete len:710 (+),score=275.29 GHUV01016117.1:103-2232(+)
MCHNAPMGHLLGMVTADMGHTNLEVATAGGDGFMCLWCAVSYLMGMVLNCNPHWCSAELPVSPREAAANRLNAGLGAAMNSSPSKMRSGNQYSGQHQAEPAASPNEYSQRQYNQRQVPGGGYSNARPQSEAQAYPEVLSFRDGPAAVGWAPAADSRQQASSQAAMLNQPPARQVTDTVGASAAVQLAAGVSLTAETTTFKETAPAAATKRKKSGNPFSKASKAQQQQASQQPPEVRSPPQEQGQGTGRRKTSTTTFGMRLSGSMMAAFNGWLVNEAVTAATTAATTAAAAAFSPEAPAGSPAAAPGQPRAARISSGDDGAAAAVAGTPSKWSLSGLLARATSLERQHHIIPEAPGGAGAGRGHAAASGLQAPSGDSSLDDDYSPHRHLNLGFMCSSNSSTDDESLGGVDDISSGEEAEAAAAATASASGTGSTRRRRKAAGTAAAGLQPAVGSGSSYVFVQRPEVAKKVKAVRRVLLWQDPAASWRVLGCGLYLVMLVGYIPEALHYMQLTTLLPGVALLYLGYNLTKPWAIRGYCRLAGRSSGPPTAKLATFEAAAADHIIHFSGRAAAELGIWTLAVLSLVHRALRGRRFTTSAWTVVTLWFLLLISELRVMDQTLLAMFAYLGLFTVPWMYNKFKHTIDTVVYETINFLTLLVVHAERWAYALALLAGGLVWQLLESEEGSLVVRATAAALAATAVLVWRVAVADL